jgi:hypothetical protein
MWLPGLLLPHIGNLVCMCVFFDAVGYAANPTPLRDLFGVEVLTIEKLAAQVSRSESFG